MQKFILILKLMSLILVFHTSITIAETIYLKSGKVTEGAEVSVVTPQLLSESQGELYVNEDYGFEIRGPKGWVKEVSPPIPGSTKRESVAFYKHTPREGKIDFPHLLVTIDFVPEDISNAVDFSKFILQQWKEMIGESGGVKVIEEPYEIEINGIKGSRAIFELEDPSDEEAVRMLDYKFMRENLVVSVMGMDWPAGFDAHVKEFEQAINTFKFQKKF